MKHLSDYMQDAQTELFNTKGVFFAFSKEQFDESKVEGVTYVNCKNGMLCPEENVKEVINTLDEIYKNSIALDLKENKKEGVIKRELYNHECFYTGDITDCVDMLENYPITKDEILEVFKKEIKVVDDY